MTPMHLLENYVALGAFACQLNNEAIVHNYQRPWTP